MEKLSTVIRQFSNFFKDVLQNNHKTFQTVFIMRDPLEHKIKYGVPQKYNL